MSNYRYDQPESLERVLDLLSQHRGKWLTSC